jgi:hypothetical protein
MDPVDAARHHELNSLLDGSLRTPGLALRELEDKKLHPRGIDVAAHAASTARVLPMDTPGTAHLSGLRYAVGACVRGTGTRDRAELDASLAPWRRLAVAIYGTGPGVEPPVEGTGNG